MKITFEETTSRKEWLHTELLNSLTYEIIEKAKEDQFYEVNLLVNGIELEPILYNKLLNGIEKYIDSQAQQIVLSKLQEVEDQAQNLKNLVEEVIGNIKEKFL